MSGKIISIEPTTETNQDNFNPNYELKDNIINFEMFKKYNIIILTC